MEIKEKMNALQRYLTENGVSKYQVSKATGISQMTLSHATADTKKTENQTVKVIVAVAKALDKTPGEVLNDLLKIQNKKQC